MRAGIFNNSKTSDVLILARTLMNNNRVCIGGFSYQENRYIRLLNENGYPLDNTISFKIGEIYEICYQPRQEIGSRMQFSQSRKAHSPARGLCLTSGTAILLANALQDGLGLFHRKALDVQMRIGVGRNAELGALELATPLLAASPVARITPICTVTAFMTN